ncbi:hypothetical protein BC351_23430 [Paenibacillus ferrarius]|uniref:F5/8 type C domain-containing protein n=1 Tax=Paenibacillus ferrarius TaxID=1469647 RepID=A0A1V4HLE8_9BACL|nr:discoidin domain-containing protein [Paenibacillus ferrarius]OPH58321.1 hypothetical protein BC351_23430 [Paenibacillus ferrarius]
MHVGKAFRKSLCFMLALLFVAAGTPTAQVGTAKAAEVGIEADVTAKSLSASTASNVFPLSQNWNIQSSAIATASGSKISTSGFATSGWFGTTVPNTVLGALVNAGNIKDPYIGQNMAYIDESRFTVPWWYRTEFTLPASEAGKKIAVNFQGINYKADIWLNGKQIANSTDTIGSFRSYELDITDNVTADGSTKNTLAVQVTRPDYVKDLTIYWVDWVPRPADNNMGIWRDVLIKTSDTVKTRNPFVTSTVDANLAAAHLNAYVELSNTSKADVTGSVYATIKDPSGAAVTSISKTVTVKASAKDQEVSFLGINVASPQLWWPINMGDHPLYTVDFSFNANGKVSDRVVQKFGIREVSTEMNVSPSNSVDPPLKDMVQFYINHKPVLIKAGGYSPTDLLLRRDQNANNAVVQYVKDMGLNTIRDEGKFNDDQLLQLLDENGILFMAGWVCCDRWQQPASFTDNEAKIAGASLYSQLRELRVHPSMIAWLNGSDNPPSYGNMDGQPPGSTVARGKFIEQMYLDLEHQMHWEDFSAIISSASAKVAELTGTVGGMHMDATYDYAPPAMYFEDMKLGGAFGFTSEAGPGPSLPVTETLKKILPASALWPYNVGGDNYQQWNYHASREAFGKLDVFQKALDSHYGSSTNLEEFNIKAQVQQYDAQRAQFEAVNANKYTKASGWIQWMLNNSFPSLYWNLFDFYLNPNGSYFGVKKANEPVHIMFDYGSKEVKILNSTKDAYSGLTASVKVYNIDSTKVYDKAFNNLNVSPDGASPAVGGTPKKVGYETINFGGKIKTASGITIVNKLNEDSLNLSPTYFIRLELRDASNQLISVNTYAQTKKKDLVRYQNHDWNYTPQDQYADFTELQSLNPVDLQLVSSKIVTTGSQQTLTYTVKNNGSSLAFAVFAKIKKGTGGDLVAPVKMEDNYFVLLPGEQRTLTAEYAVSDLNGAAPVISLNCYNNIMTKKNPTPTTLDLAKGKKTAVSSTESSSFPAKNAVDDSVFTEWQSNSKDTSGNDPQWLSVDLGASKTINRTITRWGFENYAQEIKIQVSDDNKTWQTVATATNPYGSTMSDIAFNTVTKRYVKIVMSGKRPGAPQVGSGGSGQGFTGLNAVPAAKSFKIGAFEVYGSN